MGNRENINQFINQFQKLVEKYYSAKIIQRDDEIRIQGFYNQLCDVRRNLKSVNRLFREIKNLSEILKEIEMNSRNLDKNIRLLQKFSSTIKSTKKGK